MIMEEKNLCLYTSMFSLLLLFPNFGTAAAASHCPSFSCGRLHNLSSPFRRKGDPSGCGRPAYELDCAGDEAVIHIGAADYYVTQVIQNRFRRLRLRLVDPNLVNGTCRLPSQPLLPYHPQSDFYFDPTVTACSVSCREEIHDSYYVLWVVSLCSNTRHELLLSEITRICQKKVLGFLYHRDKVHLAVSLLIRGEMTFFDCVNGHFEKSSRTYKLIYVIKVSIQIMIILIALVLLGRFLVAPMIILFFLAYKLWLAKGEIDIVERFLRNHQVLVPKRYAYSEIVAITRHFRDKLGQGGFGSVFKGELPGGVLVAVKLLGDSKLNGDDFINEVSTIGKIHHVHVVRLVGFCAEDSKRALVYEYMVNGSLDKYIFADRTTSNYMFASNKLMEIATGIARGIDYLHRGCEMQILHFDIKPHNILLDRNFNPKIADFGLAKLYPRNQALVSVSAARGTIGYIAPELISRSFGVISYKADVYSFGMLLLEMAGKRRNVNPRMENSSQVYYPSWIYDKLSHQLDEAIRLDNTFEIESLEKKLALIGLWCIQTRSYDRPTMSRVLEMLETDVETLPLPPKPFHSSTDTIAIGEPCSNSTIVDLASISESGDTVRKGESCSNSMIIELAIISE